MLQQFADHGRDGIGGGGRADGLQIAAGRECAAFALDDEHADIVVAFDFGGELLQFLRDGEIDGVEGARAVERDGGDRAVDPEQRRIVGQDGCRGCAEVRAAGGQILVQDEATSVVWGMPGAVARQGLADAILPLDALAPAITKLTRRGTTPCG